jgi:hypothetical protein
MALEESALSLCVHRHLRKAASTDGGDLVCDSEQSRPLRRMEKQPVIALFFSPANYDRNRKVGHAGRAVAGQISNQDQNSLSF